ncbi:MAG: hypothetical protein HN348_16745 [Proteobacteria bacterium]|jgi:hypothetical protein|nr:hypothetical protein [Pseudomonadota bacterium]
MVSSLDVLLASYSGFTVIPAYFLATRLYERLNGLDGLVMLIDSGRTIMASLVILLFLWACCHVLLPIPALATAIGIRLRHRWGRDMGFALGGMLVFLVPFGTILGIFVWMALYRGAAEFDKLPELEFD